MTRLTEGMGVRETQDWIRQQRKNEKNMSPEELRQFKRELRLIQLEDESKWDNKLFNYLKTVGVWIGMILIILGGVGYKILE